MTPSIAILGAGPSGLVLARLLELKGIDYVVFDRDSSANIGSQGGTLDIRSDSGQKVLRAAGLFEQFQRIARYEGQAFKAMDKDCNMIWNKKYTGQEDAPEIDRKDLKKLFVDTLPTEKLQWNSRFERISRNDDGLMAVHLADGSILDGFKLVVGADGAWSKARSMITSAKPIYTGHCFLQAIVLKTNPIYDTVCERAGYGSFMSLSAGKGIFLQRLGDGSYNIYVALPGDWSKTNSTHLQSHEFTEELMANEFQDWSPYITDMVKYCDGFSRIWPFHVIPSDSFPWKSVPGVTLVGDAAHLCPPSGEGANYAMYDSLQLAEEIEKAGVEHLNEAVARYEEKMFSRARVLLEEAEEIISMFFDPEAPAGFKRWLASMGVVTE